MKSLKTIGKRTIKAATMVVTLVAVSGCIPGDYSEEDFSYEEDVEEEIIDTDFEEDDISETGSVDSYNYYDDDFIYKPVLDYTGNGNFEDITFDFGDSYYQADVVGRWYEDCFSNGYYIDIYGNGTWQYNGEKTINGTYDVGPSAMWLTDSMYGLDVIFAYYVREDDMLYLAFVNEAVVTPRMERVDSYSFCRLDACTECEDIEAYYAKADEMEAIAGKWIPESDELGNYAIKISAGGSWSEWKNGISNECGLLTDKGNGQYEASEANAGGTRYFEIKDGHLYYDGYSYVVSGNKMGEGPAPIGVLGKWLLYNDATDETFDEGFILNKDWTFSQFEGEETIMTGRFIILDDKILFYDNDGNQVYVMRQDSFLEGKYISTYDENYENVDYINEEYANGRNEPVLYFPGD